MQKKKGKLAKPAKKSVNSKITFREFKSEFKKGNNGNYSHKSGLEIIKRFSKGEWSEWQEGKRLTSDFYVFKDKDGLDLIGEYVTLTTALKSAYARLHIFSH